MAHKPDRNTETGTATVSSVLQDMWHREGHVISDAPSREAAQKRAGHDFTVKLYPMAVELPTDDGAGTFTRRVDGSFATVRTDRNTVLGVVGPDYQPLQNDDAFAVLDPMLDAGLLTLTTAGTFRGGRDVWMQGEFVAEKLGPKASAFFTSEGIRPYVLVLNNHAGRRAATVHFTPVRVVCANTLRAALAHFGTALKTGNAARVRHTKNVAANLAGATAGLVAARGLADGFETVAADFLTLRNFTLSPDQFRKLVLDVVAPDPRDSAKFNAKSRKADSSVARAAARRTELTRLWTDGAGHTGDLSAWEAWNGVVEALDHDAAGLWPTRGEDGRIASEFGGAIGTAKTDSLRALLAAAR
jgi:phage/plasmid-like protein (TIGR03299 family)